MRSAGLALLFLTIPAFAQPPAGPSAALYPDTWPIAVCASPGVARARLVWSLTSPAETQIRVGSPAGTPLTGWNTEANGSASTGDWVTDGMSFFLVNPAGETLASTVVSVRCGDPNVPEDTRPSWLPLTIGNEWNYRFDSRSVTGAYSTMRVASSRIIGGELWFAVEGGSFGGFLLREDENGRIWRVNELTASAPQLLLDPTTDLNPAALYPTRHGPADTLFISFTQIAPLDARAGSFRKGTGMLEMTSTVLAGSSGGFGFSYKLIRARIGGKLVYDTPDLSITLGVESQQLALRPGLVPNCAVPCYFVACSFVPGTDPPNTFKPCTRARLTFNAPVPAGATAQLRLTNSSGETLFQTNLSDFASGESSVFQQLPLYSAPNLPLPPGAYLLTGTVNTAAGQLTSTMPIEILR
ncbi:MAG: hypothetical protein ABI972_20645 [Acidobacteriota bacterium]